MAGVPDAAYPKDHPVSVVRRQSGRRRLIFTSPFSRIPIPEASAVTAREGRARKDRSCPRPSCSTDRSSLHWTADRPSLSRRPATVRRRQRSTNSGRNFPRVDRRSDAAGCRTSSACRSRSSLRSWVIHAGFAHRAGTSVDATRFAGLLIPVSGTTCRAGDPTPSSMQITHPHPGPPLEREGENVRASIINITRQ